MGSVNLLVVEHEGDGRVPTTVGRDDPVAQLLERSHDLGADPRVTNYAGGNTSCKVDAVDPVDGRPVTLLHVKGSGGDLGTLTRDSLAVLVVERVEALRHAYRGEAHEDEMVELLEHCRFGLGGAAPSIDTAMHALLPERHVDHLHPDAVIALATAADGEALVKECYAGDVVWIPWRRPGFELGVQLAAAHADRPGLRGAVLGGHGLVSWGQTSAACAVNSLDLIRRAEFFLAERGRPDAFGPVVPGREPLSAAARRARAAALGPVLRGLSSSSARVVGHFDDSDAVLDFLARDGAPRLAALGTSCPDHFLRTKVRPLFLDLDPHRSVANQRDRITTAYDSYRADYERYYRDHAEPESPAMRGSDPTVVLVPGVGMWSYGADAQTARVAGEFYLNAVNVMRGAEAVSTYTPIPESEKFRIEYWQLEEAKLRRRPAPRPLAGKVAMVTGAGSGIGRAVARRLGAEGAVVLVLDIDADRARATATDLGGRDRAEAAVVDVADPAAVAEGVAEACAVYGGLDILVNNAGLSISAPLLETSVADWDRQHAVMARGSFLMAQAAARVLIDQGLGGDIVYVVSKNAIVAGPHNIAYGTAKADQAHQVRLLAAELGDHGIRVNGVNPDGVVQGSGIFADGWGAQRAAIYGVPEEELGRFYSERTLLKTEVLPDHVASAVFALVAGDLPLTTGTLVPVDGGVPAAFVR